MKQILCLVSVLTLMSACSQNDMPFSYENINANIDKYLTDKTVSVEVPTGSIAVEIAAIRKVESQAELSEAAHRETV